MTDQRQQILERGSYFPGDWVRPRFNPGTWMAMVDVMEIFTGHRSITRDGRYEMFDGPVGVQLRVEAADKSALSKRCHGHGPEVCLLGKAFSRIIILSYKSWFYFWTDENRNTT